MIVNDTRIILNYLEEISKATRNISNEKAFDQDEIPAEEWKLYDFKVLPLESVNRNNWRKICILPQPNTTKKSSCKKFAFKLENNTQMKS